MSDIDTVIAPLTNVYFDNANHPFVRGTNYRDPARFVRVGPRGGRVRMTHGDDDVETLMQCVQVVARYVNPNDVLALCARPRFTHPDHHEDIQPRLR